MMTPPCREEVRFAPPQTSQAAYDDCKLMDLQPQEMPPTGFARLRCNRAWHPYVLKQIDASVCEVPFKSLIQ